MILASAAWLSLTLTLAAALAYAVAAAVLQRRAAAGVLLLLAWLLHGAVLAWGLIGQTPRFGFAPALSFTAWLVVAIYTLERRLYPQLQIPWVLCLLGAAALLLTLAFPGSVLSASASPWMPLHLALGLASYGLIAVAVAHAWFMVRTEDRLRQAEDPNSGLPLLTLERLTFRFAGAGFVLLSATLLAGLLFDESLYGTVWKWNHKTVFSVLSWLTFAVLLLGRAHLGWRGRHAARLLYIGSGLLLLAYAGSRFVLEVLLGRIA